MVMRILIGVSGSIATYKVCEVVSQLTQQAQEVQVVLTDSAAQFVSPLTFATLSRHRAFTDRDFWHPEQGRPLHIGPLSANTLSKLALGLADNLYDRDKQILSIEGEENPARVLPPKTRM